MHISGDAWTVFVLLIFYLSRQDELDEMRACI